MPAILFAAGYHSYQLVPGAKPLQFALCETFGRILWSICVCYLIFACAHDSGGPMNTFLSLPMWQPISRLSYAIYLIHVPIIKTILYSTETPLYFDGFTVFQNFISYFVLSTFIAIPLTLAFELPIDAIKKMSQRSEKR